MSLIQISDLSFAYEGSYDNIFEHVSFSLDTNWKLGFIGRNGRGKTTFLKLLLGEFSYSGRIQADVSFAYFPYAVPDKKKTALEIFRFVCPEAMDWEIACELQLLDTEEAILERPFETLSNGEQTKVLLAALFLSPNAFLLIDEPTNHLDAAGRDSIKKYLKRKKGFILVSHDRALLDECVDHVLSINRTDIEIQKGNFSSWWENKERRDHFEAAQNERLKKDISRLGAAARQSRQWSDQIESTKIGTKVAGLKPDRGHIGHQAAKMMKRSKAIETRRISAMEEKEKLLKNLETAAPLELRPLKYRCEELVFLEKTAVQYGSHPLFAPLSFTINQGERIALLGKNGCGKSSLLKLICGFELPHVGQIKTGSGLRISYIPQNTSSLQGSLSDYADKKGLDETLFKAILRKLDFSRTQFEKDIADFSEGQKKKVLLAGSLCEHAHLYIWDEPLNYIDVLSRMQIEEAIKHYQPTLLFTEHDSAFVDGIATRKIKL